MSEKFTIQPVLVDNTDVVILSGEAEVFFVQTGIKGEKGDDGAGINVIDNLISTSATDALSGNQGRVLDEKILAIESSLGFEIWDILKTYSSGVDEGTVTHNGLVWVLPDGVSTIAGEEPGVSDKWKLLGRLSSFQVAGVADDILTSSATLNDPIAVTADLPAFSGFINNKIINFSGGIGISLPTNVITLALDEVKISYWGLDDTGTIIQSASYLNSTSSMNMITAGIYNNAGVINIVPGALVSNLWQFAETSRNERNLFVESIYSFDAFNVNFSEGARTLDHSNIILRSEGNNPTDLQNRDRRLIPAAAPVLGFFELDKNNPPDINNVIFVTELDANYQWDDATVLTTMSNNKWYVGDMYIGADGRIGIVRPDIEYNDQAAALAAAENDPVDAGQLSLDFVKFFGRILIKGRFGNGSEQAIAGTNYQFIGLATVAVSSTPVVDNLTTPSVTSALSANQGFIIDGRLTPLEDRVTEIIAQGSTSIVASVTNTVFTLLSASQSLNHIYGFEIDCFQTPLNQVRTFSDKAGDTDPSDATYSKQKETNGDISFKIRQENSSGQTLIFTWAVYRVKKD